MDLTELFDSHAAIAGAWPEAARRWYQLFTDRIARDEPLSVTLGKGGLSYYKTSHAGGAMFVGHFNATPRAGQADRGFADFRRDTLAGLLDADALIADLQAALAPAIRLTAGKVWCGLHFAIEQAPLVADALRDGWSPGWHESPRPSLRAAIDNRPAGIANRTPRAGM